MSESLKKTAKKLLKNKFILYVILFLAVTNVLGYLAIGNFNSVIFFILVSYLSSFFNKNMIVILLTAMIATSVLNVRNLTVGIKEGMKNKKKSNKAKQEALEDMSEDTDEDTDEVDDEVADEVGPTIDRNKTDKIAFQSLQEMIGKDGVHGLQKDTQNLIKRQEELKESMKSLAPMMNTAKNLLNSIDMNSMSQITNMLGKFNIKT
jgi:hypothetical protein|tara:strand:+ start:987 stop:1604 length:618 start_codon:yes stop_codon:yes gene_type:complete